MTNDTEKLPTDAMIEAGTFAFIREGGNIWDELNGHSSRPSPPTTEEVELINRLVSTIYLAMQSARPTDEEMVDGKK